MNLSAMVAFFTCFVFPALKIHFFLKCLSTKKTPHSRTVKTVIEMIVKHLDIYQMIRIFSWSENFLRPPPRHYQNPENETQNFIAISAEYQGGGGTDVIRL